MVQVQVCQIQVPPGQRVELAHISWAEFEAILADLGEHRTSRVAYSKGTLEIMAPLPEHERGKIYLGDFVKILLDELGMEWESLGSTTFKEQLAEAGLEPDDCFYIANARAVMGKNRLDLTIDPPPDLAIEVDLTSKTQMSAYRSLRVPEVWCHDKGQLKIKVFQDNDYVEVSESPTFPGWPLPERIPEFMALGQQQVMSQVIRQFHQWVRVQLQQNSDF
jgi:Uma2 family endonuclease